VSPRNTSLRKDLSENRAYEVIEKHHCDAHGAEFCCWDKAKDDGRVAKIACNSIVELVPIWCDSTAIAFLPLENCSTKSTLLEAL